MDDILHAAEIIVQQLELNAELSARPLDRPRVSNVKDAYRFFMQDWEKQEFGVEEYRVMLLTCDFTVIGVCAIPQDVCGDMGIDPKLVFAVARMVQAFQIIIALNRYTGNDMPKRSDHSLCDALVCEGCLVDVQVTDYIIVTPDGFYSFAFEGDL